MISSAIFILVHAIFIKMSWWFIKSQFKESWFLFILGPTSVGPATEYTARLDVEIDSAQQGLKK